MASLLKLYFKNNGTDKRRITYSLRCAAVAAWPTKKNQSALRAFARTDFNPISPATFFCALKPLRGFFTAAVKTSHTTGTLCAIGAKFL
jgi:hypothetical protein